MLAWPRKVESAFAFTPAAMKIEAHVCRSSCSLLRRRGQSLREELNLARQRDSAALGRALAAGEPEPEPEAPAIEVEIERNVQRSAAMTDQVLEAQRRVAKLVLRHKDAWAKDLLRHLSDSGALCRAAIVALEQARGALAELVQVCGWLQLQRLGLA